MIIDEYDASINRTLGRDLLVSPYRVDQSGNPFKQIENIYGEFLSLIKTACDSNVARCFITGVTPLVFTSGFNIALHITHDLRFASLYGFTEDDVRNGLARLKLAQRLGDGKEIEEKIMESWRRDHRGYCFHPEQKVALYNPTCVLHGLGRLEQILWYYPPPSSLRPEQAANYLLTEIGSDSNSMPAEATLRAIEASPYAPMVIAEALSSDGAEVECAGGVANHFRLSNMHELATDRRALVSFMFYTGALTYAPRPRRPSSPLSFIELKHSLCIPNGVARKEFAGELQRMLRLDQIGMENLHESIVCMVDKTQADPFCQALEQFLLRGLRRRYREDPFEQSK